MDQDWKVMKQLAKKASRRRAFQRETSFGRALTRAWLECSGASKKAYAAQWGEQGVGRTGQERTRGVA